MKDRRGRKTLVGRKRLPTTKDHLKHLHSRISDDQARKVQTEVDAMPSGTGHARPVGGIFAREEGTFGDAPEPGIIVPLHQGHVPSFGQLRGECNLAWKPGEDPPKQFRVFDDAFKSGKMARVAGNYPEFAHGYYRVERILLTCDFLLGIEAKVSMLFVGSLDKAEPT